MLGAPHLDLPQPIPCCLTHRAFSSGTCERSSREPSAATARWAAAPAVDLRELIWVGAFDDHRIGRRGASRDEADAGGRSTLAIAVMVFQLRVVTGTPKSRSNVPR